MERKYIDAPRTGERVGAAGWCTACGAAWRLRMVDGQEVCSECHQPDDQEDEASDADRIRTILAAKGLSQRGVARELGIDERTMRRYCAGDLPVPNVVWLALDALRKS